MEKSYNKIISVYIIFCALIGMLFVSVYYFQRSATKQIDLTMDDTTNLNQYFYGIDPVEVSGEMLTITGWVADKNADLNYVNRKIILVDDAQKAIELKTIAYDRGLTSFFNTGHDYTLGGLWQNAL